MCPPLLSRKGGPTGACMNMSRLADIQMNDLSPATQEIAKAIISSRSGVIRGPYAVWLRTPPVAAAINQVGSALRNSSLSQRLFELAVLIVAAHWSARYVQTVHEKAARDAGLPDETITLVREGRRPQFTQADDEVVYDVVSELCTNRDVAHATYQRAVTTLGVERTIELVTTAGYYTTAAMMVKAFAIPVPKH